MLVDVEVTTTIEEESVAEPAEVVNVDKTLEASVEELEEPDKVVAPEAVAWEVNPSEETEAPLVLTPEAVAWEVDPSEKLAPPVEAPVVTGTGIVPEDVSEAWEAEVVASVEDVATWEDTELWDWEVEDTELWDWEIEVEVDPESENKFKPEIDEEKTLLGRLTEELEIEVAMLPWDPMEVEIGSNKTTERLSYPMRLEEVDAKVKEVSCFPELEPNTELDEGVWYPTGLEPKTDATVEEYPREVELEIITLRITGKPPKDIVGLADI